MYMHASSFCRAVALLNSAGQFEEPGQPKVDAELPLPWYASMRDAMVGMGKRVVLWFAFQRARRPEQIQQVLEMVYSSTGRIGRGRVRWPLYGLGVLDVNGPVTLCGAELGNVGEVLLGHGRRKQMLQVVLYSRGDGRGVGSVQ